MADALQVEISFAPEAVALLRAAPAWPARLMRDVAAAIDLENELTVGHIQAQRMSRRGPETLGVVTNRLRLSLRPSKAEIREDSVDSSIGSNVGYMGPHEFGFQGLVTVRAHERRVFASRGGGERTRYSMGEDGRIVARKTGRARRVSGVVQVRSHAREMNIPSRAPIRRGIADRARNYRDALTRAALNAFSS